MYMECIPPDGCFTRIGVLCVDLLVFVVIFPVVFLISLTNAYSHCEWGPRWTILNITCVSKCKPNATSK